MIRQVILDTGPLVAAINRHDVYHQWVVSQLSNICPPLMTCEAVISEACFLLRGYTDAIKAVFEWINKGTLLLPFQLNNDSETVQNLMMKYADLPMSFADACLVRMSEYSTNSMVLTTDSDFLIYRKHGREIIRTIMPLM